MLLANRHLEQLPGAPIPFSRAFIFSATADCVCLVLRSDFVFRGQVELHSSAVFLVATSRNDTRTNSGNHTRNQEGVHLIVEDCTNIPQSNNTLTVVRGLIPPETLCLSLTLHVFLREVMDAHKEVRFLNLSLGNAMLTFSKKETLLERLTC